MAKKILIVDDEVDVMKVLVYRLKAKGYEILTAADGQQGLNIAKMQKPNLIILDYRLPDIEAVELAKWIKQEEGLEQVPIILITASLDSIESKAKECGAVDYLPKPFESDALYEKVKKYIG